MFRIDHQWARFRLCLSFRSALFWITAAVLLLDSVLVMPASQLRNDVLLLHPEAPRILAGGRVDDIPFPETNSLVAMFAEPSAWDRYRSSIPGGLLLVLIETGLVALLLAERRRRKRSQRLLERRFAIEQVISESSTRLSDCPADRVDAEIESSLQALMTAEGADRSSWFVLIDSGPEARLVSSAHRPGADAEPAFYSRPELPWSTEVLLRGEPVVVPDLDLLPPEADRDRHYFAQKGVRSVALVPCSSGTGARGVLVLVCLENARAWPEALISRLAVLGNIYASATMRREAQEAKQQSEQRFRYLFEEAPFGIAIEDIDGQLLFVNPALASLLGYTTEELKGTKCGEFADNEDERDDWAHFQEMRAGLRESYQIEKRYSRKDGIRVWGRLSVSLLKGTEQRPPIVFATVEDITEKKAREQELQFVHTEVRHLTARLLQTQEEERKRIARELHDDIGQRLSLLMIDLDQLKTLLPADRTSEQAKVRDLLLQLDEVVSDVHELSHQLHSTKLQHLGLTVALREVCRLVASQHRLTVELRADDIPTSLPEPVSLHFYRVAQEALNNAAKHSRSPRIEVSVWMDHSQLRLRIKDFGIGFDAAVPSNGIGLATMQERMRMIGGRLQVNSMPGTGTELLAEANLEQLTASPKVA